VQEIPAVPQTAVNQATKWRVNSVRPAGPVCSKSQPGGASIPAGRPQTCTACPFAGGCGRGRGMAVPEAGPGGNPATTANLARPAQGLSAAARDSANSVLEQAGRSMIRAPEPAELRDAVESLPPAVRSRCAPGCGPAARRGSCAGRPACAGAASRLCRRARQLGGGEDRAGRTREPAGDVPQHDRDRGARVVRHQVACWFAAEERRAGREAGVGYSWHSLWRPGRPRRAERQPRADPEAGA
jgi:hypothetical protein